MSWRGGACLVVAALCMPAAIRAQDRNQPGRVNVDAQILLAFDKRAKDYVALHQKLEATLTPLLPEPTPAQVDAHQRALSQLVRQARPRAKVGDIFGPETRALIRRLLARTLTGPDGAKVLAAINEDNPGPLRVQINGRYPAAAPRSTVPAQVLQMLPRLPEELEYRFLGRRLILLDSHAYIVLDYVSSALPK